MKLRTAIALLISAVFLLPLGWMVVQSVRDPSGAAFRLVENYAEVWNSGSFGRYFLNSLIVSTALTVGGLTFCSMGGYFFSRSSVRGKPLLLATVVITLIIPAQISMVPLYAMMVQWDWIDTYWALIIPWVVNPFGIFLMKQFFDQLPKEMEESARIDGAGDWRIFFRVVLPMARPALAVVGIYLFVASWNQFLFPFLFVDSDSMRTLPVGLAFYSGYQDVDVPHLMSGAVISAVPMIAVFFVFQRHILTGLTAGALKG